MLTFDELEAIRERSADCQSVVRHGTGSDPVMDRAALLNHIDARAIEAQARPAVEAEGLRAALEIIAAQPEDAPDAIRVTARNIARAALASDADEPEIDLATWRPPRPDFSKPPEPGNEAWLREDVQALAANAGSVGALDAAMEVLSGLYGLSSAQTPQVRDYLERKARRIAAAYDAERQGEQA